MWKLLSALLIALKLVLCSSSSEIRSSYPEIHHRNWTRSEKLDPNGILNLQWYLRNNEIVFQVTLNSRGFAAIGFPYLDTRIKGFDVVFAWVNDKTGKANILVKINFMLVVHCISDIRQTHINSQLVEPNREREQKRVLNNMHRIFCTFPFYYVVDDVTFSFLLAAMHLLCADRYGKKRGKHKKEQKENMKHKEYLIFSNQPLPVAFLLFSQIIMKSFMPLRRAAKDGL